jgi:23S rRNA (adenine2503-C2)-methyltransferase
LKTAITDMSPERLREFVAELGMKPYVATQIVTWLYGKLASSFDEMTDISKSGRAALSENCDIAAVDTVEEMVASDGTIKLLCGARDGERVECVLLPSDDDRITACLSTQAGCAMGCGFCRTASMGFRRNLTLGEITGQLVLLARRAGRPITNIVLMGMGEPLLNREAVEEAIALFRDDDAFGLSKRRITLSTSGIMPELEKFAEGNDVKIAISLNATTDEVRSKLMPINEKWPIAKIMEFCRDYSSRSRYRVTFEYVMIRDVNDSRDDAKRLVELLSGVRAKINLIPFNPFEGSPYEAPDRKELEWWRDFLLERGVQANIRVSRGQEILAACGQLASKS